MNFKKLSNAKKVGFALWVIGVLAGIIVGILSATGVLGTSTVSLPSRTSTVSLPSRTSTVSLPSRTSGTLDWEQLGNEIAHFGHNYYNALSDDQKADSDCVTDNTVHSIIIAHLTGATDKRCSNILTAQESPGLKKKVMALVGTVPTLAEITLLFKGMNTYIQENISNETDKESVKDLIGYLYKVGENTQL